MKCPKCETENAENRKFCRECGARLLLICPGCDFANQPGDKFCGECGRGLAAPKKPDLIDFTQPGSYTPHFLAEKILTNRSSLVGERKLVTVLFADVASFTSISEGLDPEDVHRIMDGCFKILMDEIHRVEGTINQFTGDGIMALFGAPLAHEDHAQRACRASLAIQKAMEVYGEKVKRDLGVVFEIRIGLNSGPVVVGAIGEDLRMDYTAVGDTTNLAARMESMAEPGSILISAGTASLVKEYFDVKSLGKVPVKGKKEPQSIYELLGVGTAVSRIDAAVARGLTRFFGRRGKLAVLKAAFRKVQTGSGQVVGIVGEAGVGKSRLTLELRKSLPADHLYLEGRCSQFGSSIPFLPVLDILKSYYDIKEGDQDQEIKEKMRVRTLDLDENLQRHMAAYFDLLSLEVEDESWREFDPGEKRMRAFEALRDLLIRLSDERPLLLVVDDLHWMDKTSEEFLDYLIGWVSHCRILLLFLYRPEYTHSWGSRSYYTKIGLDQLSGGTSAEMVRSILGGGEIAPDLRELILNRAAGNPFFTEELTRTLVGNGSIRKQGGRHVLSADATDMVVPDTVQGIIASRMDRLEDDTKRTMQTASVIGRDFSFPVLQTVSGIDARLNSHLLTLQSQEFIYEKSIFPELEYIFKHALTQEVAYDSLLVKLRNELHEKIGAAIEQIYAEKLEEFFEILARHYSRSNNLEKATHYLRLSGDKAMRNNSAWEAFDFYKEAMRHLKRLPAGDENKRKQLEILHLTIPPIIFLGLPEEGLTYFQEGAKLSEELQDRSSLTRFYSNMGLHYSSKGNHIEGRTYTERAFREAEKAGDVNAMSQTVPDLCLSYQTAGDYPKVMEVASKVMGLLEKTGREREFFGGPVNVYASLLSFLGDSMGMTGRFDEGISHCERGLEIAEKTGDAATLGVCEFHLGSVALARWDGARAREHLENAIERLEAVKFVLPLSLAWCRLGIANTLLGQPDSGKENVEKGLEIHLDMGNEWLLSLKYCALGICRCEAREQGSARRCFEKALGLSKKYGEKHVEGVSTIWLGRCLAGAGPKTYTEAEGLLRQGLEILDRLGAEPDRSLAFLFLGELCREWERREEALENVRKAEGMVLEMGMGYWPAKIREFSAGLSS